MCNCAPCEQFKEIGHAKYHVVECPVCNAKTGKCKRPSEHERFSIGYMVHVEREILALALGLVEPCVHSNWARWRRGEKLDPEGWFPNKKQAAYMKKLGVEFGMPEIQQRLL